jgi:methylaspartate ammonia-lyase
MIPTYFVKRNELIGIIKHYLQKFPEEYVSPVKFRIEDPIKDKVCQGCTMNLTVLKTKLNSNATSNDDFYDIYCDTYDEIKEFCNNIGSNTVVLSSIENKPYTLRSSTPKIEIKW